MGLFSDITTDQMNAQILTNFQASIGIYKEILEVKQMIYQNSIDILKIKKELGIDKEEEK